MIYKKILYISISLLVVFGGSDIAYAALPITQTDIDYINRTEYYRDSEDFSATLSCSVPNPNGVQNNQIFFIGDSLTVGAYWDGKILEEANNSGYSANTEAEETWRDNSHLVRVSGPSIEAYGGKSVPQMSEYLSAHPQDFANVGTIVVALGTNDSGANRLNHMLDFIDYLRSVNTNPNTRIVWVNTYYFGSGLTDYNVVNAAIDDAAAQKGFDVIDYATAAEQDSTMAPPTSGSDRIHLYGDSMVNKVNFIMSSLSTPTGGAGGSVQAAQNIINTTTASLTEDQKIAQTFIVGFTAEQKDEMISIVEKYKIGGVFILEKGDKNDVFNKTLFDSLHQSAGIPLIVASDEEGGTVQRFASQIGEYPSAAELGERSAQEIEVVAKELGLELKGLGINTDLAPVVDLALPGSKAVTELDRGFSDNPDEVVEKAGAFARGLRSSGITPTYKHFPGLGSTTENTDFNVGESPDIDTLREQDLLVYEDLINQNQALVMINNAIVPGVTEDGEVFGTSAAGVSIIRDEYGFSGVITTDALNAEGVKEVVGGLTVSVPAALEAGVTMPLFAYPNNETEFQSIINSVKNAGIDVSNNFQLIQKHKAILGVSNNSGCGVITGTGDNRNDAIGYLISKGYTVEQAVGMVANIVHESGVNPIRMQCVYTYEDGISKGIDSTLLEQDGGIRSANLDTAADQFLGSGTHCGIRNLNSIGWGLVQWTPFSKMRNNAKEEGATDEQIDSLFYQLDFLVGSLTGEGIGSVLNETSAGTKLKATSDVREAAAVFAVEFERCAECEYGSAEVTDRQNEAVDLLTKYGSI